MILKTTSVIVDMISDGNCHVETNGSVQMANERTVIDMIPNWFIDLFFIFLGVLVMCGLILAVAIMVGIVRAIIADRKKGRGS